MPNAAVIQDYEVMLFAGGVNITVPYSRLVDTTPFAGNPAALQSRINGTQLTGVIIADDPARQRVTLHVPGAAVIKATVRNVTTYAGSVESAWAAMNIGDPVFYDRSATMPAATSLSTAAQDNAAVANPIAGFVVELVGDGTDTFPKGTATASTQTVAVLLK